MKNIIPKLFLVSMCCCIVWPAFAQQAVDDGDMEIITPQGKRFFHNPRKNKSLEYRLQRWQVEDVTQKIDDDDNIYAGRTKDMYKRRLKLIDRTGQGRDRFFEFVTDKKDDKVLLTLQEDFMFYRAISPMNEDVVYSWDLFDVRQFVIDYADNFEMATCPDEKAYIIVRKHMPDKVYVVYDTYGNKVRTLKSKGDYDLIVKAMCE